MEEERRAPLNHPHRRLGALATAVSVWSKVRSSLTSGNRPDVAAALGGLEHDFWSRHYNLAARPIGRAQALIGASRVTDFLANVWYPLALMEGRASWPEYKVLRAELRNRRVQIAAARLFGTDPRQKEFLRTVMGQQGLLQIYEDFCLRDASDCARCSFPEQLMRW